jgi:hypothetical protein
MAGVGGRAVEVGGHDTTAEPLRDAAVVGGDGDAATAWPTTTLVRGRWPRPRFDPRRSLRSEETPGTPAAYVFAGRVPGDYVHGHLFGRLARTA